MLRHGQQAARLISAPMYFLPSSPTTSSAAIYDQPTTASCSTVAIPGRSLVFVRSAVAAAAARARAGRFSAVALQVAACAHAGTPSPPPVLVWFQLLAPLLVARRGHCKARR
jgi:hypothetical protein